MGVKKHSIIQPIKGVRYSCVSTLALAGVLALSVAAGSAQAGVIYAPLNSVVHQSELVKAIPVAVKSKTEARRLLAKVKSQSRKMRSLTRKLKAQTAKIKRASAKVR